MKKYWYYLIITLVLIAIVFYFNNQTKLESNSRDVKPQVGFIAPNFELLNEQNESVSLEKYRGKPVFINFWASWCPPCKEEMPYIQEAYEKYNDEVVFLGINVTSGDSMEDALAFIHSNNYDMPILFDLDGNISDIYRARSIPTSYFIDENGIIRAKHTGSMSYEQIDSYLKTIMEEE